MSTNIPEDIILEHIVPFLQWRSQNSLSPKSRECVHTNARIIQKAWKKYRTLKNVISVEDISENQGVNNPVNISLYDKIITWTYYFLYRNTSEQHIIPEYIPFVIHKLRHSNQISEYEKNQLEENYNSCCKCKNRRNIAMFLGISKNILTPEMLIYVGL